MTIRLGYACLNLTLGSQSRTCRLATLQKLTTSEQRLQKLIQLSQANLDDLIRVIEWNRAHHIWLYRLPSGLFPHITNPKVKQMLNQEDWSTYLSLEPFISSLSRVADLLADGQMRISFHPGQYNQLGSPREEVVEQTLWELNQTGYFLDYLADLGAQLIDPVIVLHGGGVYGDKGVTLSRWMDNFYRLSSRVRSCLVLENDERHYRVEDLYPICLQLGIPVLLDLHHYNCYQKIHGSEAQLPLDQILNMTLETWDRIDRFPKFHLSEQNPDKRCGAHSDWISKIPQILLDLKQTRSFDLMLECKKKELVVLDLYQKYGDLI